MPAKNPLVLESRKLADSLERIDFKPPIRFIYNPLVYARAPYEAYLKRFADSPKPVVFIGMNPGPWGMAQTGVPFGEVSFVRDWLGIHGAVGSPIVEHPRLPVLGFRCRRSEVSGKRLWGLMRERFGTAGEFSRDHFVSNYCPLLFIDERGRNITPDKLGREELEKVEEVCDGFLSKTVEFLKPRWLIGIGRFAESRIRAAAASREFRGIEVARIPHPSPASPLANRDWAGQVSKILEELGVW